jgi:hypothetical protein
VENGSPKKDDETTQRTDYPAEFLSQLRLGLQEIDGHLEQLGERLPWASVAERRSIMFRLSERFEVLGSLATDAAGVTRDHVAALTMYLAKR